MNTSPIGILSGTFDPIHLGHIHLATTIYKLCELQKILLIPCHRSPFKELPIANAEHRLNMIKLATKDLPYIEVEDYETKNLVTSYSINTLEYLHKKNQNSSFALIMGIDVFDRFDEWHRWREILELTHLIVVGRKGHEKINNEKIAETVSEREIFDHKQLQNRRSGLIYAANIQPLPITATEIRTSISQGKNAEHLVNKNVWEYINDHQLYDRSQE